MNYKDICIQYEDAETDAERRLCADILREISPFSATPTLISGRIEKALREPIAFSLRSIMQHWVIDYDVPISINGKPKKLQRGLVWTAEQKSDYILHVARTRNIFGIVVCEVEYSRDNKEYQIIDGKQRLSTVIGFMQNQNPVNLPNGEVWYFNNLPKYEKDQWSRIWVNVNMLYDIKAFSGEMDEYTITDEQRVAVFEWLNYKATPQDAAHLKYLKQ